MLIWVAPLLFGQGRPLTIAPLFGQPASVVSQRLGRGRNSLATQQDNTEIIHATHASGTVRYVNGRAKEIDLRFRPDLALDWKQALGRAGYSAKGVSAHSAGAQRTGDATVQEWKLRGGGIPKDFRVVFTQHRNGMRVSQQFLSVTAPNRVVIAPLPAQRKAILDALRIPTTKAFHGQPVKFVVAHFGVGGGWAFVDAEPISADPKRTLSWLNSDLKDAVEADTYDETVHALLQLVKGRWIVRELVLGPTDVAWEGWWHEHRAPKVLFPYPEE